MRPTAADRERIASGIELSEHLAQAVKDAQKHVLERHMTGIKKKESKFFEDMDAQRKLEKVSSSYILIYCVSSSVNIATGIALFRNIAFIRRTVRSSPWLNYVMQK